MIRIRLRRALAGLAAVGAAIGLGACSAQPGVALQVGDASYSEADITTAAAQAKEMFGSDVSREDLVWSLVSASNVVDLGTQHDVTVSDDDVTAVIQQEVTQQYIASAPDNLNPALNEILRAQLVANELQQASGADTTALSQELATVQEAADIRLNPRYGTLDSTNTPTASTIGDVLQSSSATGSSSSSDSGSGDSEQNSK